MFIWILTYSNHDEHDSQKKYQTFPHHSPNMILWCNQHLLPGFFPKCQGVDFARAHFPASSPPDFPHHLRPWNRPSPCNARWSCAWQWLHRSWCSHFGGDKCRRFFIGKSNEKHHPTLVIGEKRWKTHPSDFGCRGLWKTPWFWDIQV